MEYVYASLLLHEAKQEITENNISKILETAGIKPDSTKVKALVASLKDVNIEEAIQKAATQVAPVQTASAETEKKKEEAKDEAEQEKAEEIAAEGLGSLFG